MNTLTPDDYASEEQIARNHTRLRAIGGGRRTRDMFAEVGEDLTLLGEVQRPAPAKVRPAVEQTGLFDFGGAL